MTSTIKTSKVEAEVSAYADEVFRLMNEARTAQGLPTLEREARLEIAARKQAQRCAEARRLDHDLGGELGQRVSQERYRFSWVAENLSSRRSPSEVVQGWLRSVGHRRNMLDPRAREGGVGVARNDNPTLILCTCAIFARPRGVGADVELDMSSTSLDLEGSEEETSPANSG